MRDAPPSAMMMGRSARDADAASQQEMTTMYPYQLLTSREMLAQRDRLWTTIVDFRQVAGLKLMADDMREQARREATISLALKEAGVKPDWLPRFSTVRERLGAILVSAGERLQGVSATVTPTGVLPGAATGGSQ